MAKPEGLPDDVWSALPEQVRVLCRAAILKRDLQMRQRGYEEGLKHGQLERERLQEILEKYRKYFGGKCPQKLCDLSESDVQEFTPFPSLQHLLIFYKHFVAGPTLYKGKLVPRYTTIDGYAGYSQRYRNARRRQENAEHPDLFDDQDLDDIPLRDARQKLEKVRSKLRKKKAVEQYHAAVEVKAQSLRSTDQLNKFHGEKKSCDDQLDDKYEVPFDKRKRSAHFYQGTANLNVEQEFLIWLLKLKADYPIVCLADKFLGSYDHAATKVRCHASLPPCPTLTLPLPCLVGHSERCDDVDGIYTRRPQV